MYEKVYSTLEFDKVKEKAAFFAVTNKAKEEIISSTPIKNERILKETLDKTEEALKTINAKGFLPLNGYAQAEEYIIHAQKGGTVREGALIKISSSIKYAAQIKSYIEAKTNVNLSCPLLEEEAAELRNLEKLAKDIDFAIISEDEINDNASPALREIRRKIKAANSAVKNKLNSMIHGSSEKFMQDNLVTMRNGRYVVPVKSEHKGNVDGIVHDTSQSGLTLFVEPRAVVDLNNELKQLEVQEQREIEEILKAFSQRVAEHAFELRHNEKILTDLDRFFASARFAYENELSKPLINNEGIIDIKKARHPLIDRKKAVASDIAIGENYTQIVITGPNTGGKTVALKTLGLCVLLALSGFFIPANENSEICLVDSVFADIGDEQSIAQSLSTFSSHMVNIAEILNTMDENSLVLLDELGAGTDPSEGAALAKAILKHVKNCGALSVATTHYNEIKQYALTEPGVVNASVEFDTVNLRPTYRLLIGLPGKSNAFDISGKLGISEDIINEASLDMEQNDVRFEDMITSLQNKLAETQQLNDEARALKLENEKINETLKSELERFNSTKDTQYSKMITEAKKVLNQAKDSAKRILAEAQNSADKNSKHHINEIIKKENEKLNALMPESNIFSDDDDNENTQSFAKNDEVFIPQLNSNAVIVDITDETALVQVGAIRTKIPISKLRPAAKAKEKVYAYSGMKAATVSSKLDIRGITAAEVPIEVEKFLDDAMLAGLKTVTIIHGKGEGILRKAVNKVLKENTMVDSFRVGGLSEGSTGATIVYLK